MPRRKDAEHGHIEPAFLRRIVVVETHSDGRNTEAARAACRPSAILRRAEIETLTPEDEGFGWMAGEPCDHEGSPRLLRVACQLSLERPDHALFQTAFLDVVLLHTTIDVSVYAHMLAFPKHFTPSYDPRKRLDQLLRYGYVSRAAGLLGFQPSERKAVCDLMLAGGDAFAHLTYGRFTREHFTVDAIKLALVKIPNST